MPKKLTKEQTSEFIRVCKESQSMAKACATLGGYHFNTFRRIAIKLGVYSPNQSGFGFTKKQPSIPVQEILEGKHPYFQTYKLKIKLFEAGIKENRCEECGLDEWNDKTLMCELEHIDGDRTNHRLENLKILCPNCHSQTDTYRAKNIS